MYALILCASINFTGCYGYIIKFYYYKEQCLFSKKIEELNNKKDVFTCRKVDIKA